MENNPSPKIVNPIFSQRNMQIYSITENELTNLTTYEKHQTNWSSIGSAAFSTAFTLIISAIYAGWDNLDSLAKAITICGGTLSIILGLVFWNMASNEKKTKQQVIETIKTESINLKNNT